MIFGLLVWTVYTEPLRVYSARSRKRMHRLNQRRAATLDMDFCELFGAKEKASVREHLAKDQGHGPGKGQVATSIWLCYVL